MLALDKSAVSKEFCIPAGNPPGPPIMFEPGRTDDGLGLPWHF